MREEAEAGLVEREYSCINKRSPGTIELKWQDAITHRAKSSRSKLGA